MTLGLFHIYYIIYFSHLYWLRILPLYIISIASIVYTYMLLYKHIYAVLQIDVCCSTNVLFL